MGGPEETDGLSPSVTSYSLTCKCENDTLCLILNSSLPQLTSPSPLAELLLRFIPFSELELRHDFRAVSEHLRTGATADDAMKAFEVLWLFMCSQFAVVRGRFNIERPMDAADADATQPLCGEKMDLR